MYEFYLESLIDNLKRNNPSNNTPDNISISDLLEKIPKWCQKRLLEDVPKRIFAAEMNAELSWVMFSAEYGKLLLQLSKNVVSEVFRGTIKLVELSRQEPADD